MNCPKCNSEMWDNRGRKRNPKAPDFKCKNTQCNHAIWPEKKQQSDKPPYTPPKPNGKSPTERAEIMAIAIVKSKLEGEYFLKETLTPEQLNEKIYEDFVFFANRLYKEWLSE